MGHWFALHSVFLNLYIEMIPFTFDFDIKYEFKLNMPLLYLRGLEDRLKGDITLQNWNTGWSLPTLSWSSSLQAAQPFGFWFLWGNHDNGGAELFFKGIAEVWGGIRGAREVATWQWCKICCQADMANWGNAKAQQLRSLLCGSEIFYSTDPKIYYLKFDLDSGKLNDAINYLLRERPVGWLEVQYYQGGYAIFSRSFIVLTKKSLHCCWGMGSVIFAITECFVRWKASTPQTLPGWLCNL